MLDPSDSHPSPPSVFALSYTSHLLLSTSASPPTIYLRNLTQSMPPILLCPRCSSSAVVAANFHPDAANVFLLAFADGSAAVYDASLIFRDSGTGQRIERPASSGTVGEIGFIKGLHAITSKARTHSAEEGECVDDPDGTSIHAEASSITAVALVSGQRATAITVGADGKCCVVDFTQPTKKKAVLLTTWHLRRPATSLSVIYSRAGLSQLDGATGHTVPANKDYCIAVGRQDGKVLLFDLGGKPLGKQVLDPKGARVVDVEWEKKEIDAAFIQAGSAVPDPWKIVPKRKSLGTEVIKKSSEGKLQAVHSESMELSRDRLFNFPMESPTHSRATSKAVNHLDLPYAVGPKVRNFVSTPKVASGQPFDSNGSLLTSMTSSNSTSLIVEFSNSPPPVPPRPTPKPGGKLSERRAMTARERQLQSIEVEPNIAVKNRRKTANDATPTKLPVPKALPARGTVLRPRSPPHHQAERWKQRQRDHQICVSPEAIHDIPRSFQFQAPPHKEPLTSSRDITSGDKPHIALDFLSPKSYPPSKLSEPATGKSSTASLRSYTTASSQLALSENSTDTVVDWSTAATSRRLDPSICEPSPIRVTTELSFLHQRPPKIIPKEGRIRTEQKRHESIDASTQTSPSPRSSVSQLSQDTAVADAIVHWPSLRKSPRIADISAGVVSATASVLDLGGYTDPTPPTKLSQEVIISPIESQWHSSSSSKKDCYIPPRPPLEASTSTANLISESITHACPCEPRLQATIATSLGTFRADIEHGFKAQRQWLEELVRGREEDMLKLEEENKLLKAELARAEKGKGISG